MSRARDAFQRLFISQRVSDRRAEQEQPARARERVRDDVKLARVEPGEALATARVSVGAAKDRSVWTESQVSGGVDGGGVASKAGSEGDSEGKSTNQAGSAGGADRQNLAESQRRNNNKSSPEAEGCGVAGGDGCNSECSWCGRDQVLVVGGLCESSAPRRG